MGALLSPVLPPIEVASCLKLHPETVRRLMRSGEIPATRIGGYWRTTMEAINAYLEKNWKGEQRAHRLLAELWTQAEVEPFGFHDIRHAVARYLNDVEKVGIKRVQQILRHQRQTTTEIYLEGSYTDAKPDMERLALKSVSRTSQKTSHKRKKGSANNS